MMKHIRTTRFLPTIYEEPIEHNFLQDPLPKPPMLLAMPIIPPPKEFKDITGKDINEIQRQLDVLSRLVTELYLSLNELKMQTLSQAIELAPAAPPSIEKKKKSRWWKSRWWKSRWWLLGCC
nr:PREDICTED: uncharacterized protein LOC109031001 [Bemisia tabaci]